MAKKKKMKATRRALRRMASEVRKIVHGEKADFFERTPKTTVKTRWYKFWIKSNRGTNAETYVQLPHRLSRQEVRDYLEKWCAGFGAWHISENFVSYGYEKVQKPPKSWEKRTQDVSC